MNFPGKQPLLQTQARVLAALTDFSDRRIRITADGARWSIDEDALILRRLLSDSGLKPRIGSHLSAANGHVFLCEQFMVDRIEEVHSSNKVSFALFHGLGRPEAEFANLRRQILQNLSRIFRVQVTNEQTRELCLSLGFRSEQLQKIYIGVDTGVFRPGSIVEKEQIRRSKGVPVEAFVVGSFQKDGHGWGEGLSPKLIKGPDILVSVLSSLRSSAKDLFVVLTGPSRGYVKQGLAAARVPFQHFFLRRKSELPEVMKMCDVVLVTSREEGGPKSVLEGMASGVPVVSTRVGQAQEIIRHYDNGFLADVEDTRALVDHCTLILQNRTLAARTVTSGLATARQYDYSIIAPEWREFFAGN